MGRRMEVGPSWAREAERVEQSGASPGFCAATFFFVLLLFIIIIIIIIC